MLWIVIVSKVVKDNITFFNVVLGESGYEDLNEYE